MFFVSYTLKNGMCSFSYSKDGKKRKYFIGDKSTTKQKLSIFYPHIISFHPMVMNMMYLGPSERRNFLDEILTQSFQEYKSLLLSYKKILTSRNKVLKNIFEKKSNISELDFWNSKFIDTAEHVYIYRKKISDFFMEHVDELKWYFFWKIEKIEFVYETKIDISQPRESLRKYIKENTKKEIMLRKTLRWPHLDDFHILLDTVPLIRFASRGEVKSVILGLKFLETSFIEQHSQKQEILFLIDDLLSELDTEHRKLLLDHIRWYQSIISSIEDFWVDGNKIFI